MKIFVRAKPSAKIEKVEKLTQPILNFGDDLVEPDLYAVWVKEPPVGGRANTAIGLALAKHFKVSPSSVHLIKGERSKRKIFEILTRVD